MLNVLVTGTSSGFGRLVAEGLAARGHRVVASMREPDGRNARVREELERLDGVEVVEIDVTDDASVERGAAAAEERTGGLDALVNNAGVGFGGLLETVTSDQARAQLETNVLGPLRLNRAVLPGMRARRSGLLVHVSSGLGRFVIPFTGIYAASKFALEALAETYRYELATLGIDSVIVEPGIYDTDFRDKGIRGEDTGRADAYGPLGEYARRMFDGGERRGGDPREVADAIVALIEAPHGSRPLRTALGENTGFLGELNDATDRMQRQALASMGLGALVGAEP